MLAGILWKSLQIAEGLDGEADSTPPGCGL